MSAPRNCAELHAAAGWRQAHHSANASPCAVDPDGLLFEQGNRFSCPDRPSGAAAFDTYAAAKLLREAGFDGKRAEAAVAVVSDAVGHGRRRR